MKRIYILMTIIVAFGLLVATGCSGDTPASNEEHAHAHSHGDIPYEWNGQIELGIGTYSLEFQESGDEFCAIVFLKNEGDIHDIEHHAHHIMEADMDTIEADGHFKAVHEYGYNLTLNSDGTVFTFEINDADDYIIFLEHFPSEFDMKLFDSNGNELEFKNPTE